MRVFAIDPSINHLGWALMDNASKAVGYDFLAAYETIDAPTEFKQEELVYRLDWIMGELDDTTRSLQFDTIAIECPEPWGAYKSMASSRSGSLQILTLLTGALTQWAIEKVGVENVKLIKVSQHKGQLPKWVTKKRMEKKYNCKFNTDHESDACSIGNYCLERNANANQGR